MRGAGEGVSGERMQGCEALIVGGGPAGAVLGIQCARRGLAVELLEQSTSAHHKVCGEFLSREAIAYLEMLGVSPRELGAVAIHGVRLHRRTTIAACELPFPAMSLTRRTLDEALLALAAREGVRVLRGKRAEALTRIRDGWQARVTGGTARTGRAAFLATGKHDLAGLRRPAGVQNNLVGFKMYFRLAASQERALDGWVELFLFPGGYAGLQKVEGREANLCLLVDRDTLKRCGGEWTALLAHMLRSSGPLQDRLQDATPTLSKPLAIASIPYGLLPVKSGDGLWRLGDQAAVIPSFSGDGISMALHSALLAAEMYGRGATAAEFAQVMRGQLRAQVQLATAISQIMVSLPVAAHIARLWQGLLGRIAAQTRVPAKSWVTTLPGLRHNSAGWV